MKTTIRKIGNSEGIIIPKEILERMGLRAGDNIDLSEEAGKLVLKPLDDDFNRQLEHAERFMDRYKVALKKLAE
ncbi:AbrB family transcriptional regulator [Rhizobium sp. Leaf306]|mgnify:CR=1 FL=1|jgi:putative addiction module antidote|uniref:Putative addiction module antidote n=1 Tax=Rhizobium soli TaxID=424798 RepID=A0A7X0MSE1_9HYPH|nr:MULTISPECIES: AbrB/MazE/SpoVT family DNA-binding domain-containing protein [Rhizobium]RYE68977.1 MAG: AbrB/MazE/SpoVT family DNA-binding domain-containing protein [Rhizobiaceae bacterium]KQQ37672.1 AbrB family transcriptional regulator [Rhizobium sp. Leaf306]KQQ74249.1 AbrB family transcriptional regulator [Rhizobium sp. Leaf321]MBB6509266.1 putative addiction module antidote [Rhizobium soli]MBD8650006.1 AbrB/MazE/SpoVT family DNA-binding domain-containing protein [Rhizobium sp. CFBP 13726]